MNKIRLVIVDDHPVVRDGLRGMLEGQPDFEVVGEAANGQEAVQLAASSCRCLRGPAHPVVLTSSRPRKKSS